ncbi:MAG: hypothetical protein RLO51_27460 [Thalassobaculum sp.]|uniref:hypothetical protein n=1 Tax=Thalassobaculum sp. TaxID=2022740 RepID=UPI0032ECB49F
MSIQTIEANDWDQSAARVALRRTVVVLALAAVIVGPILIGGVVGWMTTREAGPILGEDGWLRTRSSIASTGAGFPLVSAGELEAAGLSLDEARKILRR